MSNKETKLLVEAFRLFLKEAPKKQKADDAQFGFDFTAKAKAAPKPEPKAEPSADLKGALQVHIYDFDGVVAEFDPALKSAFIKYAQQNPVVAGSPIQLANTLAIGASVLATTESCAKHYKALSVPKRAEPYYVISKLSNPAYIFKLKYLEELKSFLTQNGLELKADASPDPEQLKKGKEAIIRGVLGQLGAPAPAGVFVASNAGDDSKKTAAKNIPAKHNPKTAYVIHRTDRPDDVKEGTMVENGLIEGGAEGNRVSTQVH